jgi:hypothetical protein
VDVFLFWFVDYYALIGILVSKILRKKSVAIAGGFDAVRMPDIDYGLMNSRIGRLLGLLSFRL